MIQQLIIDKASIIIITSQRQGSSSYTWSPRPRQPLGTQKPELQSRHQEDLGIQSNFQRKGRKSIFCKNSKAINLVSPGASSPLWLHQSFWNNPCSFMHESNHWSTPSILCQYLSLCARGTFVKSRLLESRWNSEIEDTMEENEIIGIRFLLCKLACFHSNFHAFLLLPFSNPSVIISVERKAQEHQE